MFLLFGLTNVSSTFVSPMFLFYKILCLLFSDSVQHISAYTSKGKSAYGIFMIKVIYICESEPTAIAKANLKYVCFYFTNQELLEVSC